MSAPKLRRRSLLRGIPTLALAACSPRVESSSPRAAKREAVDFRSAHEGFRTALSSDGPSPSKWVEHDPPAGVEEVRYRSGALELKAWYARPLPVTRTATIPAPALVYFHNDFVFTPASFAATEPFRAAGWAVLCPMLRGENGNPGRFELLRGELDDARAAVRWIHEQAQVDAARVYAFGHSIGGGVAAMLSLFNDEPVRRTGSCGGLYVPSTFGRWAQSKRNSRLIRFDPQDTTECEMRVLGPHLDQMVREHVAYIGDDDSWFITNAEATMARPGARASMLTIERVPGDHMSSLKPALTDFLRRAEDDRR